MYIVIKNKNEIKIPFKFKTYEEAQKFLYSTPVQRDLNDGYIFDLFNEEDKKD